MRDNFTRKPAAHDAALTPPPGPLPTHIYVVGEGEAQSRARRMLYRPGVFLWVLDAAPMERMEDETENGRDFWDAESGSRPHILRLVAEDGTPIISDSLLFFVRPGHERADAAALDALLAEKGPRLDGPRFLFGERFDAQIVAILPESEADGEAAPKQAD